MHEFMGAFFLFKAPQIDSYGYHAVTVPEALTNMQKDEVCTLTSSQL